MNLKIFGSKETRQKDYQDFLNFKPFKDLQGSPFQTLALPWYLYLGSPYFEPEIICSMRLRPRLCLAFEFTLCHTAGLRRATLRGCTAQARCASPAEQQNHLVWWLMEVGYVSIKHDSGWSGNPTGKGPLVGSAEDRTALRLQAGHPPSSRWFSWLSTAPTALQLSQQDLVRHRKILMFCWSRIGVPSKPWKLRSWFLFGFTAKVKT